MFICTKYFYIRGFAAVVVLSLYTTALSSQTPATLPDSVTLKTVVIQATRTSSKSPVPHTNISAEQLARINQAQDIPFLLTQIPSLVETSDAGNGTGYTGLRIRGSDPTRVNVTINGIPLNDAESQGVYWVDLPDLASSAAEIQVQRGVGTSTNGAGAFGATVNIDLSHVEAEPFALITNSVGSFQTRKHSAYIGTGLLHGRIAFSGRLSQIVSEGYVDRASANLRSYHLTGAYIDERQSVQAHLLSGQEVTYQAWNGLPAQFLPVDSLRTFNTAGMEKPGAPYSNEIDHYTQRHYLLHYKRLIGTDLRLQLNGHYTRGYGYYEQYKAGQRYADYGLSPQRIGDSLQLETDLIRQLWLDNHFYGSTFALYWSPASLAHMAPVFVLGGAYSQYKGRHYGEVIWAAYGAPDKFRYYDNDARKQDANAFAKAELLLIPSLTAMLDLQYRQVQYSFLGFDDNQNNVTQAANLHFFNPKAGLNWAFIPNWSAYAFFGIGHREPNRDDYTQSTPASRPLPEILYDWEAGVKTRQNQWNISANIFVMNYRNQLALDGRINDVGAYTRANIPHSYRAGVEVESAVQATPWLSLLGNLAWSRNQVPHFVEYRDNWDDGSQEKIEYRNKNLAFSPAWIARGEVSWRILSARQHHDLAVSISGKYVGKQYLDNTGNENSALPACFFSDFRLNYDLSRVIGEKVSIILAVNNILDARYVSNGWLYRYISTGYDDRPFNPYTQAEGNGIYHQAGYFPQAGRNFMATVAVKF